MTEPVYLLFSILKLNKILMFEFYHDYVKPKYSEKTKLYYMDTLGFIVYIKTHHTYKNIIKFVGLREKTFSYLRDDGSEDKKAKGAKGCFIKRKHKFGNCKNCLEAFQLDNKTKYLEKINLTQIVSKKN